MPIELGKKISSPKKTRKNTQKNTHTPLKVIKINNTNKNRKVPSYSYNIDRTSDADIKLKSYRNNRHSKKAIRSMGLSKIPHDNQNRNRFRSKKNPFPEYSYKRKNNDRNTIPDHPQYYDNSHNDDISPVRYNNNPREDPHNPHPLDKKDIYDIDNNNINYQYIPELQHKQNNRVTKFNTAYKMPRRAVVNTGVNRLDRERVKKKVIPKKVKKLYCQKRLYLKQESSLKSQKDTKSELKAQNKYFNPNIFVKNKNKSEHFSKLAAEDIYICSVLSEDFNIIKNK